jgi:hypothetical protein
MEQKRSNTVGDFGVGRLFPEMTPRQLGPTSGLKVRFTNDRGVAIDRLNSPTVSERFCTMGAGLTDVQK